MGDAVISSHLRMALEAKILSWFACWALLKLTCPSDCFSSYETPTPPYSRFKSKSKLPAGHTVLVRTKPSPLIQTQRFMKPGEQGN